MKRWIWLAVLPYVVSVSTIEYEGMKGTVPYHQAFIEGTGMQCESPDAKACDWIYDMAGALNAAHIRRTHHDFGLILSPQDVKHSSFSFSMDGTVPVGVRY